MGMVQGQFRQELTVGAHSGSLRESRLTILQRMMYLQLSPSNAILRVVRGALVIQTVPVCIVGYKLVSSPEVPGSRR